MYILPAGVIFTSPLSCLRKDKLLKIDRIMFSISFSHCEISWSKRFHPPLFLRGKFCTSQMPQISAHCISSALSADSCQASSHHSLFFVGFSVAALQRGLCDGSGQRHAEERRQNGWSHYCIHLARGPHGKPFQLTKRGDNAVMSSSIERPPTKYACFNEKDRGL